MAYKDITPGDKIAKAKGARIIESKKGSIGVEVGFEFEEPSTGAMERLTTVFWMTPAAIERSMETLYEVLGFNGSEQTDDTGKLTDPQALDYSREVKLVVELKPREKDGVQVFDNDGNPIIDPQIKWVNRLGGSGFQGVAVDTVKSKLASVGFRAAFLAAKQKAGGAAPGGRSTGAPAPSFNSDEKLPF